MNAPSARFLVEALRDGASFERTLMLGRQRVYADPEVFDRQLRSASVGLDYASVAELVDEEGYVEPLFRKLGAREVHALDASSYEASSIVHDLNEPIGADLSGRYTLIFDGGTLEHVFNFPVAIRNCMEMLEVNGTFVGAMPANNLCGHGFYQFSPEVLFRVFSEENGFEMQRLVLSEMSATNPWYEVTDPALVGRRVEVVNAHPTYLLVRARKVADVEPFRTNPQQSNYVYRWRVAKEGPVGKKAPASGGVKSKLTRAARLHAPRWVRSVARRLTAFDAFRPPPDRDEEAYRRVA